ncbi:TetR/AcrR family transcriptional regulator [Mameliella alba]|uniref:TetR/AcrR family transcriptional regulator n=1 Tax=Mameliella alba TaxID=561184 RepID=UPI000B529B4B|nr:TetR/AcrR family transcriptional regulator [Mameliella alba]OWV40967.1 TetR family transcriptional regulator [Mameliella alba]
MRSASIPKTKRGQDRRAKILGAAEMVMGKHGFSAASIAQITRAADTALGTFYIYFQSKEEIFHELVLEMGRITRSIMSQAIAGAPNRLEAERAGLRAFLMFVQERPTLYRIVEEARFVDPVAYRDYFSGFAEAYAAGLRSAETRGEISSGDAEVRAWALMGLSKALGDRYVLWEETPDIDRVVDEAHALICKGLAP